MTDIVYVLTNEAMPGLAKIGLTTDSVESRIAQLSAHSGVPLPFECYYAAEVDDCARVERLLHGLFSENRLNPKREFFAVDPERVVLAMRIGQFKEVTPGLTEFDKDEQHALEKAKARRPRIRLEALGIRPGEELVFSRDDAITARVTDGNKVVYNHDVMSLSAAAVAALQSLGYSSTSVSGSEYWIFDGELLDERRRRIEAEQFDEA